MVSAIPPTGKKNSFCTIFFGINDGRINVLHGIWPASGKTSPSPGSWCQTISQVADKLSDKASIVRILPTSSCRVLLHGRLTDCWLVQGPFGPRSAHKSPYGPAWARPGPAQYTKPFRKLTFLLKKGPCTNQPCVDLPSVSTRSWLYKYIM